MKKYVVLLITMFVGKLSIAQDKPTTEKAKDSIKTEVVNVVTSYAPKVTDAFKIKQKPAIKLSEDVQKKALNYTIASVPVASTFIPKSGTIKRIDIGKRERLFDNYIALGFGNNLTPYLNAYIHKNTEFDNEYGIGLNFISSSDPVKNTVLNSSFYNADINAFYKQENRYFDWIIGFDAERNSYNWYGLPTNITFPPNIVNLIKENQIHNFYKILGRIDFADSYIENANTSIRYFSDNFKSKELNANFNSTFSFPLNRFGQNFEDLEIGVSLNFLGGKFAYNYERNSALKYSFLTAGIHPSYQFNIANFNINLGAKGYFSSDFNNKNFNKFFIYPNIEITYPLVANYTNIYIGASGDLHTNSYRSLSEENPYVSPTLNLLQTNEQFNFFGGLKGVLSSQLSYNIKTSYKKEEDKPFFALNPTKHNKILAINDGLLGYEYGNSFNTLYDDVNTLSVLGEIEYNINKNTTLGFIGEFNTYQLEKLQEAWNLPNVKAELFGKYKVEKWYAGANIYFVGNRKGIQYNNTGITPIDLKSYVDINLNGGYHFNNVFSVFVKANNITNSNYQRFTNFNTHGIQVIGGLIWKFDSFF